VTVTIRVGTTIGAAPDRVWAAIEDLETHTDWMADAASITFLTEQRSGVGTELACVTRVGPLRTNDVMRVVGWDPGVAMTIEHRGVVTGRGRFVLTPVGTACTGFAWTEELTFPWWMGGPVGERAARPLLARIWHRNLVRLRAKVEAGA